MLREDIPAPAREGLPTYVSGDHLSGRTDLETVIDGNAELRRGDTGDPRSYRLEYYQPDDLAKARGNVRINRAGNTFEGPLLELKVDAFEGFFNEPRYRFLKTTPTARPSALTSWTTSAPSSATPPTPPASAARAPAGCPTGCSRPPASVSTTKKK